MSKLIMNKLKSKESEKYPICFGNFHDVTAAIYVRYIYKRRMGKYLIMPAC